MSLTDSSVIELNVGGVFYATTLSTLTSEPDSLLARIFSHSALSSSSSSAAPSLAPPKDAKGRYFLDRDGVLFRYVLDYLRNSRQLTLPDTFHETRRLRQEAEFFALSGLVKCLGGGGGNGGSSAGNGSSGGGTIATVSSWSAGGGSASLAAENDDALVGGMQSMGWEGGTKGEPGYVVVGYRGTFAFGRDGMADVKFRKLSRILVSGRVSICREVFQDSLNESRDPDRGTSDRYSARFFLKHTFIEQAFDALQEAGFRMVGSAGSGTNSAGEVKPGMDSEENKWNHYNEFVFCRP